MLLTVATLRRLLPGLLGFAVVVQVACGGSSNDFSDSEGDAGDPGIGGSSSGSGGSQSGTGQTGGDAGTSNGGTSNGGTASGGTAGTDTGGSGGTDPTGGTGTGGTETGGEAGTATGGSGGGLGGTSGLGGTAGFPTGGFAGVVGGSGGFGGSPDPLCPFRPPMGECEPNGLQCRYDLTRMCLCVTFTTLGCGAVDPRCTAMAGAPPPDGDRAIPVAIQTCDCQGGTWFCHIP